LSGPRFVVLIPARLSASRLPNKPLADLAGIPMVVRVAQRAQLSQASQVVVATDSAEVIKVCEQYGVTAIMTRDDHPSGSDRLAEAATMLGLPDAAIVVNVQGDEPLIEPHNINAVAQLLHDQSACSMSTLANPIKHWEEWHSPHCVKVVLDAQSCAMYFSRAGIPHFRGGSTDQLPPYPVYRHVGLYAYRCDFLKLYPTLTTSIAEQAEALEQLRVLWHGYRIAVHISQVSSAAGVDTPADLERVRELLKRPS
jgi:3-deoxy-manno-octulosonate cytidylyltransferase (CMP-KDO synthetase)